MTSWRSGLSGQTRFTAKRTMSRSTLPWLKPAWGRVKVTRFWSEHRSPGLRCSDQNLVTFTLPQAGFNHGSVDRDIVLFAVNLVWPDNPERQLVIVFVYQCYPGAEECLALLNGAVFHHPKLG